MAASRGCVPSVSDRKKRLGLAQEETVPLSGFGRPFAGNHSYNQSESCLPPASNSNQPKEQTPSTTSQSPKSPIPHRIKRLKMADKPPVAPKPDLKSVSPTPKPRKRPEPPVSPPSKPIPYKQHKNSKDKIVTSFKSDQPVAARPIPQERPQKPPRKFSAKTKASSRSVVPEISGHSHPVESRPRLDPPQTPPSWESNEIQLDPSKHSRRPKTPDIDSRPRLDTPTRPPEPSWRGRKKAVPNGVNSRSEVVASAEEEEYSIISETRKVTSPPAKGHSSSPTHPSLVYNVTSHVEESRKRQFRTPPPIPTTAADSAGMEEYSLLDRPDKPKKQISSSLPSEPYSMLDIPDEPPTPPNQHPEVSWSERPQAKARKGSLKGKSGDHQAQNSRDRSALAAGETGHKPGVTPLAFQRPPPPKPRQRQRAKPPTKGANFSSQPPHPHSHSAGPDSHFNTSTSAHGEVEQVTRAPVRRTPPQDGSSLEEIGYETWRTFSPPRDVSEEAGQEEAMGDYMSGDDAMNSDEADSRARNARIDDQMRVRQCDTSDALYNKGEVDLATVKRTPVVKDGYCDIELPDKSPPEKTVDFMTVKHARIVPSYSEVDTSEPLCKNTNLSTVEHAQAADGPGYYNVDVQEGKNLSTGEPAPPAERPGYYNVDVQEGKNLSTGEPAPPAERPGYYNVDVQEGKNLSIGELAPPAERPGYYNVDVQEDESLSTGEHAPGAERPGYYNFDVPKSKDLSNAEHTPAAERPGYYNVDTTKPQKTSMDEHTSKETEAPGYYNVELSEHDESEKHVPVTGGRGYYNVGVKHGEEMHHSTVEHTAEPPGYYNVELTEPEETKSIEHTPEVAEASCYYNVDVPKQSPPDEVETFVPVKRTPAVPDRRGYCEVDLPEPSTGENAPVKELPDYYLLDVPEEGETSAVEPVPIKKTGYYLLDVPETEGAENVTTVDHFPVTEASSYYNVELPEQSPSKVDSNLLTVKHPPVVTDTRGYCDIDIPELSPPDENENLAMVKHPSVVTDARGYCDIDVPDLSPPEENLATFKHPPIVSDARGYCDIDVAELSPPDENLNLSTVKHTPIVSDARGYCDIDIPELTPPDENENPSPAKHIQIVADARGYCDIDIPDLSPSEDEEKSSTVKPAPVGPGGVEGDAPEFSKPKPREKTWKKFMGKKRASLSSDTETSTSSPSRKAPVQNENQPETSPEKQGETASEKASSKLRKLAPPRRKVPPPPIKPKHQPNNPAVGMEAASTAKVEDVKQDSPGAKSKSPKQKLVGKIFSRNKSRSIHMSKPSSSTVPVLTRDDSDILKNSPVQASPGLKKKLKVLFSKKSSRDREETVAKPVSPTAKTMSLPAKARSQGKFVPPEQAAATDDAGIYSVIPEHENSVMSSQDNGEPEMDEDMYAVVDSPKNKRPPKQAQGFPLRRSASNELAESTKDEQSGRRKDDAQSGSNSPRRGHSMSPHPIATLPRTKGKKQDIGQLYATVTKPKNETRKPGSDQTPPAVPPKPQEGDKSPGAAEDSSTGEQATEDIIIVPVDRDPGLERGESQYIPSSEIKHMVSVGGEQYAVVSLKPKSKRKVSYEEDDALNMFQSDSTVESSTKGHEQLDQEQAVTPMKEIKSKVPPPKPPRNFPPKPPPYHKGDLSPMSGSSVPPPLPKRDHPKPSSTDKSTSTTTLEGKMTKILKGEVFQPPSHPPPLPPPYCPSSPLSPAISTSPPHQTSPPPLPPQMSPSDKSKVFQFSRGGPPSFPPPPPPGCESSQGGGIMEHTYEVPAALMEGHTQIPDALGEDIEAENQPDQGGELFEMDDFPPEAGYEVVANVRGKGGQKKAGAFNLVHIDESSVKGSAQVERPPHLYTVVPDDVKGGGGGRRTKMVAIPMRKPNLYEAISENVEEGGGKGGGRGGKPKRIATPTGAVEAGKSPKSPRKRVGNFPQLKPKDKPPPAPPASRKPKPAEPVPNSGHQLHSTSLPEAPLVDPYVGKRITVAYREGDEPGESGGDGQPQFLFPSSHCQKFLAVGHQDSYPSSLPSPTVSSSAVSMIDDDSDAYSTEWDMSSGEEEEEVGPPRTKTFYIAQEVLTTERTFVKALTLLHKDFRQAVLSANRAHEKPVISEETLKQILGNIGSLLALNSGMLEELESRMEDWDSDPRIGDILLSRAPYLKLYSEYISKFDKSLKTLEEATKRYPLFAEVLHEFEAQPKCSNLPLAGYMLEIVQRIPRYKLLLSDYVNHLPDDSPDRAASENALEIISSVASHVNETIRQMDNFRKVIDVRKKLIGNQGDTLITPYRKLLKEGELVKCSRKEKQPRMFFLFSDIVIYASSIPPTNTTYKVIKRIPLDGMMVEPLDDPDLRHGFQIISTCKSFRLEASNGEEREQWINAFNTAIREHNDQIQSKKRMRKSIAADDGNLIDSVPLGHLAPPWLPDSSVSMCQLCSVQFTVTRRRHHCRACGMIFCGECSQYLAPLRYKNNKLGRVCQTCYDKIRQDTRGGGEGVGGNGEVDVDGEDRFPGRRSRIVRGQKQVNMPSVLREVKARDQNAQVSGYLMVHTSKTRRWKRKWFVVYNLVLYEFERHEDVSAKRSIALPSYQVISPVPRHDDPLMFCLRHPGAGKWYFKVDGEEQLARWVDVLQRAVKGELAEEQTNASAAAQYQNIDSPSTLQPQEHET